MNPRRVPDRILEEVFPVLREFIERECGIVLADDKASHVARVVQGRMRAREMSAPWDYLNDLMHGPGAAEERRLLIGDLVVGETSFFRSPEQFRVLQDRLLPAFLNAGVPPPFRIWSAGCATGEEPYSIAIASLEAFHGRFIEPVRILATDIHREYLEIARRGIYPPSAVRNLPALYLMRYFTTLPDGTLKVKEEVRRLVTFEELNLAAYASSPPPRDRFSAIFCRNVMIYFRSDTTRKIVSRHFESLEEGGVLFLGHSETLWGISDAFRLERQGGAFFYRRGEVSAKPAAGPAEEGTPAPPATARAHRPSAVSPVAPAVPAAPASPGEPGEGKSSYPVLLARAEKMADRDRLDEAERLCREAIGLDPAAPEGHYILSLVFRRMERYSEALAGAERALAADGRYVMAVVEIAECLSLLGREEESIPCWEEAFRLLSDDPRLPGRSEDAGLSVKALQEYVMSRIAPK